MQAVIFCGIQGTGKSTFYLRRFFDTHVRINLDMLRTRHREWLLVKACIDAQQPFVVDNTNPTAAERGRYILPAKDAGFRVVGYFFDSDVPAALARNAQREGKRRVHPAGVYGTRKRLQVPSRAEGFDELYSARITGEGEFSVEPLTDDTQPGKAP
jgi:predicted kinase